MKSPRPSRATRLTYRLERLRAPAGGVLETAASTFLLLIAVRHFQAPSLVKGLIAAGGALGQIFTPLTVDVVARGGWRPNRAAAVLAGAGALSLVLATLGSGLWSYTLFVIPALALMNALVPLLTQIYQDNYPERERGRRFSNTVMIRVSAGIVFAWAAGRFLEQGLDGYRILLAVYAGALALSALLLSRCPSRPLRRDPRLGLTRGLRHLKTDRLFRLTLMSWMLLGFGNLMMMPLRVEYLANPRYGLVLTAGQIALLTTIIPNVMRLSLARFWGGLFDRANFFVLRAVLNLGFMLGILSFFVGGSWPFLILGSVLFGAANAGGDVAWSLWVTKIAPADHVAEYMSVHTFLTGLRQLLGPMLGFVLAAHFSLPQIGILAVVLMLGASSLLIPEFKKGGLRRKTSQSGPAELLDS